MAEYIVNINEDVLGEFDFIAVESLTKGAPLIRCSDCKHRPKFIEPKDEDDRGYLLFPDNKCPCQCKDDWYYWMPEDDWYCGNAERKEE